MRENRTYGSEGGAAQSNAPFLPLYLPPCVNRGAAVLFVGKYVVGSFFEKMMLIQKNDFFRGSAWCFFALSY